MKVEITLDMDIQVILDLEIEIHIKEIQDQMLISVPGILYPAKLFKI